MVKIRVMIRSFGLFPIDKYPNYFRNVFSDGLETVYYNYNQVCVEGKSSPYLCL